MSKYVVLQPVSYMEGNWAVHHTQVGKTVELDDSTARPLVEAGRLEPTDSVSVKRTVDSLDSDLQGNVLTEAKEQETAVPSRRRSRRADDD